MKQPDTFLDRKPIYLISLFWICLVLVVLACSAGVPKETRAPDSFPDTDLIFTSGEGIGFVNADGSNATHLTFTAKLPHGMEDETWRPVITGDNLSVILKVTDRYSHVYAPDYMVLWRGGELPVLCLP